MQKYTVVTFHYFFCFSETLPIDVHELQQECIWQINISKGKKKPFGCRWLVYNSGPVVSAHFESIHGSPSGCVTWVCLCDLSASWLS